MEANNRAGVMVRQSTGYRAFIPHPLPPDPPIRLDDNLTRLLSDADRALGRLDGIATVLPNPDLFVGMYVRQEAVLSSQIEGTQSTLEDVLEFEAGSRKSRDPHDVAEVVNYVRAMNLGLASLPEFPLSLRLIRRIHGELMQGVRGQRRNPGEFRETQNWIGPSGAGFAEAIFIPPPKPEMEHALHDLERFLHDRESFPVLVHCALAHAQFETIHPFLDGNGRVGRLLITLLLCEREVLRRPLLYLSAYLKLHRAEYYDRLTAIRTDGDWEGWLRFFLRGVYEVSRAATETSRRTLELRESHRQTVSELSTRANAVRLLDLMFQQPILTIRRVSELLDVTPATAGNLVGELERLELLEETTGFARNRRYRYSPYLEVLKQGIEGQAT